MVYTKRFVFKILRTSCTCTWFILTCLMNASLQSSIVTPFQYNTFAQLTDTSMCVCVDRHTPSYPCVHVKHIRVIEFSLSSESSKHYCSMVINLGKGMISSWRWLLSSGGLGSPHTWRKSNRTGTTRVYEFSFHMRTVCTTQHSSRDFTWFLYRARLKMLHT